MRITILSCFYPFRGGIAQFNARLLEELGKDNEVFAFNFKRQYPSLLFPGKTQYVTEDDEAVSVESTALTDTVNPFSWLKTVSAIRRIHPDLLVMRYWMPFFAPCLGFIARHSGCKVIAITDNLIPHERRPLDGILTRYFLSGVDGCMTLCSEVAEDLHKMNPGMKCRISFHPLYDHFGEKLSKDEAEKKLGLPQGGKNLLFFGLIRAYKGLDILIDAFRQLPEDYQLIIAGEPYGSFEKYKRAIEESGCRERIHCFLHYIKDSEVKEYFSAADLSVLPYRSATQSGVSSVSYHFGVPMVVTRVGGLTETIGERGTGLLAEKPEAESVKSQIERYFSDAALQTSLKDSIVREKERLSWQAFCKEMINFAKSL